MNNSNIPFAVILLLALNGCGGSGSGSSSSSSTSDVASSSSSSVASSSIVSSSSSSVEISSSSSSLVISSSSSSISSSSIEISSTSSSSVISSSSSEASIGNSWANAKIGGGGYIPGLIFHPATPDVLYARTDIGGAYRWDPLTSSWIAITDSFGTQDGSYHGTETMAIDPNDDTKVYMSAGMYLNSGTNGRLYRSSDRGDHWTYVELPFPVGSNNQGRAIGERLMVDPNLPTTLFYATRTAGLWKSTDSGVTWAQVTSLSSVVMTNAQRDAAYWGSPAGVELVVFDTDTKGTGAATQGIYTAVAPDYAGIAGLSYNLYKSTDGGVSWQGVATPVADYFIPHIARAADGVLYVVFTKEEGPGAGGPASLYKFDGSNWTLLKNETTQQWTNFGYGGVSVYGSGATTKIALGVTNSWGDWDGIPVVQFSEDAGATWREISGFKPHTPAVGVSGWIDDVEIDPFNPDHVLHVTGGGVWETLNASAATPSWIEKNEGIEETANVSLVTPPAGAPYLFLNSSLDIGMRVHTALDTTPTLGPKGDLSQGSGFNADMDWKNPSYIVAVGVPAAGDSAAGKAGAYSTDAGLTWSAFASVPPTGFDTNTGKLINQSGETNIAVTAQNNIVWAQSNSVPYYTTDNGATWVSTNLPAIDGFSINRAYHLAADRQNPMKVYAYDGGGAWWGNQGKFYYSTDGGHTFTQSTSPVISALHPNTNSKTSLEVNSNVEGDVWLADGDNLYHSTDSGVNWTKLTSMASVYGANQTWMTPELFGASHVALGKAAPNSSYSAAVYLVGTVNGTWGLFRSDDMGANWTRINDDDHQFGGIGNPAADQNIYGRVYISGGGRGVLYNY